MVTPIASEKSSDCLPLYEELFVSLTEEIGLELPKTLLDAAFMLTTLLDKIEDEVHEMRDNLN